MIGLEDTWDEHLANLLELFREVRRVMRDDAVVWLNYGDGYWGGKGASNNTSDYFESRDGTAMAHAAQHVHGHGATRPTDRRDQTWRGKDLMMMPARVALALYDDGWWIRSETIWHKPNPNPESVMDRPTQAHEKVFLLAKEPTYFYDCVAVRTESLMASKSRYKYAFDGSMTSWDNSPAYTEQSPGRPADPNRRSIHDWSEDSGANLRNVWVIPTGGNRKIKVDGTVQHFAMFPPTLAELCIKSGSSEHGCCSMCGAPWRRTTKRSGGTLNPDAGHRQCDRTEGSRVQPSGTADHCARKSTLGNAAVPITVGWMPTCECRAERRRCVVLDPFGGAATTALVANQLGRDALICEVSPDYAEDARQRLLADGGMFADVDYVTDPQTAG